MVLHSRKVRIDCAARDPFTTPRGCQYA
jgi:hypothetical protein